MARQVVREVSGIPTTPVSEPVHPALQFPAPVQFRLKGSRSASESYRGWGGDRDQAPAIPHNHLERRRQALGGCLARVAPFSGCPACGWFAPWPRCSNLPRDQTSKRGRDDPPGRLPAGEIVSSKRASAKTDSLLSPFYQTGSWLKSASFHSSPTFQMEAGQDYNTEVLVVQIGESETSCWPPVGLLTSAGMVPLASISVRTGNRFLRHRVHQATRVVEGERMLQAASDLFLGFSHRYNDGHDYYVRHLHDVKTGFNVGHLNADELRDYSEVLRLVARARARQGRRECRVHRRLSGTIFGLR